MSVIKSFVHARQALDLTLGRQATQLESHHYKGHERNNQHTELENKQC